MDCQWAILERGLRSIKNFIFSGSLNDIIAQQCAAKAAYLSMLLKHETHNPQKYDHKVDMTSWKINRFPNPYRFDNPHHSAFSYVSGNKKPLKINRFSGVCKFFFFFKKCG